MFTRENIMDICLLQRKASDLTCEDFIDWVKGNCIWRITSDEGLIDFEYESVNGVIDPSNDHLCGSFVCYTENREWSDTLLCEPVIFCC